MSRESLFRCPVCASQLYVNEKTFSCRKGHAFDISASGYVNLLTAGGKHSRFPGDDKEMARARRDFLSGGYYSPLAGALSEIARTYAADGSVFLDAGCGEGYYTSAVCGALSRAGRTFRAAGFDISKFTLKYAPKRAPDAEFAVASSYRIPMGDARADILLNCFSPLALSEFRRVLKPGGAFLYVVPAREHLYEMKEILYEHPYENEEKKTPYEGFKYEDIVPVKSVLSLDDPADIENLFKMTPYFWKTPRAGRERLSDLSSLRVTAAFNIHIFKKEA
ncbi:MAG: methyltransferase domain-containing protein [Clostridia bacterium]|nr:methyltransferase domain-containing protein [Clostridia bacterium]